MDVATAFLYGKMLQEIYVVLQDELRTQEEIEEHLVRKLLNLYMEHQMHPKRLQW